MIVPIATPLATAELSQANASVSRFRSASPSTTEFAAIIVGAFAIFHGHAHGTELPQTVNAVSYATGFVVATGLLHLSGIGFGLIAQWPKGELAVRAAGLGIALAGLVFLGDALT